ncbi:MAG TPA: hypothetical protein VJN18_25080 [Polyangiaceae bacterium]|nr:hypothetical protein [Polyangiaceae bacterium]
MATNETVSQETESTLDDTERRRRCLALQAELFALGTYPDSHRSCVTKVLCVGQYVNQADGCTAERALLRWAAATSKAVAIALVHQQNEENVDLVLYDHEAAAVLAGVAEILDAAPRLIEDFESFRLCSPESTRPRYVERQDEEDDAEGEPDPVAAGERDLEVLKQAAAEKATEAPK